MVDLVLTLLLAPALVAVATLAARRWGHGVGGLVSAFPAIVGPVLVIDVLEQGTAFAAEAAVGTLLGLVALSAFAAAYARGAAAGWRWPAALGAGWGAAALAGLPLAGVSTTAPVALAAAVGSLVLAAVLLPATEQSIAPPHAEYVTARGDLAARMLAAALLVALLALAAAALGPTAGGLLAALPVLASVLAVFTQRRQGPAAAVALLRGMLGGMTGFVAFCALVAFLVRPAGPAAAFAAATAGAIAAQALALAAARPRPSLARRRRAGPARPASSGS